MNAQQRGDLSESKIFNALEVLHEQYPEKFGKSRRTSPATDARGVDILTRLNVPKGNGQKVWMTVPIEVKSSPTGIRKWRLTHPDHYKAGVVHVYVQDGATTTMLCQLMYWALDSVYYNAEDGTLYRRWWRKLFVGRMSKRGQENARKIAARRAREKERKR